MNAPANPESPRRATGPASAREALSALADGRADALDAACQAWRADADARRTWHAYQLIGDVMRSDDLAGRPARDAAFLGALRERLAAEPALLAPAPLPAATPARAAWRWPAAAAAGVAVVAGVLGVLRMAAPGGSAEPRELAAASAPAGVGLVLVGTPAGSGDAAPAATARGVLIRDPELDAYLQAHRAGRGAGAAALPGGALRNVEAVVLVPGSER
jgi:sigma-E factor negative regulatory protein RseA